ncbi:MAG: hypothetical protein WC501_04265 [Candidatus Micrarchaeia archaeon]|jgi:hypothetical protein
MPSCPDCHIYKGLWSELIQKENGTWVCKVNPMHEYTRDKQGYFHKKK